jgi:hypothetical protein
VPDSSNLQTTARLQGVAASPMGRHGAEQKGKHNKAGRRRRRTRRVGGRN